MFQTREPLNQKQKQHLSELIAALRQELERATQGKLPDSLSVDERPLLLLVERNNLAKVLAKEAATWGLQTEVVSNSTAAREWISSKRPEIVLLDLADAAPTDNDFNLLRELSACTPPIPVMVLTAQDSLLDRVKIARCGGRGFLQEPLSPQQILEAIAQVLQRVRRTEAKVMVVDDDPLILKTLHNLLMPWGIKLFALEDPLQFWSTLKTVTPDLLILDVEMPHLSGIELCQVVRNDLRWSGLPILFLTVHNTPETRQRVFEIGADDYVSKPIVAAELVTRILNRLERSHLQRTLAEIDSLTGVTNRRQSTQELTQLLHLAERCHQNLGFALLDLDCLKQINERYGYGVGDRILSRLGELLRKHFQSEDIVARWGGAEFVVGMYGMSCNEGLQRLSELRKTLSQEKFTAIDDCSFSVTFSASVVQYPENGTNLQELYQAAKVLLFQAKTTGGNQLLSAREYPPCK
jgi:diguanylate cyclase (GGDEF)-like protein